MKIYGESNIFSDEAIFKIARELGIDIEPTTSPTRLKVEMRVIDALEKEGRIKRLGAGMIRFAHRIWKLSKDGDDFYLERLEDEEL